MNRLLIIVDPQVDFISGTLPVPNADSAMDSLARYLRYNGSAYAHIIVTADRHPFDHCSFVRHGGQWPLHCVHDSVGATVWQPIIDVLCDRTAPTTFLYKGENADREEYSIFKNEAAATRSDDIIKHHSIDRIEICGLAGDVCVAETIRDGIERFGSSKFEVLTRFSPSLDDGKILDDLISKHGIICDK